MSKKIKKVDKVLSEQLMRDSSKKQMQKLYKEIKKQGGDIGEKVRKDEKSKEDKMPNTLYMDNPFGSNRFIDTWENFSKNDAHIKTDAAKSREPKSKPEMFYTFADFSKYNEIKESKDLEDLHSSRFGDRIDLNDDSWVKGTKDDFQRPMFKNLPNHKDRYPYDVLRSGKFVETKDGKIVAQIGTVKDKVVTLDIINDEHKHEWIEYDLVKLLKKLKDKELKVTSNSTSKKKKIDTPWGTKFDIKDNE